MDIDIYDEIKITGTGALNATIDATAVVDNSDGTVKLTTSAAHGFLAGSIVYIEGTTNYDGLAEIVSVPSTTTFNIKAKYVAETPAGTETVKIAVKPRNEKWEFVGYSIHLSAAPTTSENFTITLDAIDGAAYDVLQYSRDFSSASDTDIIYTVPKGERVPKKKDDILRVAWTNTDGRTYGLKLFTRSITP